MSVKDSVKAEAASGGIKFVYEGSEYEVPKPKVWPLEVIEAQEAGKFATCMRALLGEDQYLRFKKKPRTLEDLEKLTEVAFAAINADTGESVD